MWRIIKAELSYNRAYLLMAYVATVGMWFAYIFDPAGMFQVFGVPAFFLMPALFHRGIQERRERLLALLPAPVRERSLALLLPFVIFFHVGVLSAWVMQFLRALDELANEFITLSGVLTLNAIIAGAVYIVVIRFSLAFNKRAYRWAANILLGVFLVGVVLLFFSFKISLQQNPEFYVRLRDFIFHSPALAVAANAACAGLIYLSMIVRARCKSYLS
jgi:hypothetical protein